MKQCAGMSVLAISSTVNCIFYSIGKLFSYKKTQIMQPAIPENTNEFLTFPFSNVTLT